VAKPSERFRIGSPIAITLDEVELVQERLNGNSCDPAGRQTPSPSITTISGTVLDTVTGDRSTRTDIGP